MVESKEIEYNLGAASPFNPLNRGFDYFYGFLTGGHDYHKVDVTQPVNTAYLQGLIRNKQVANFEGYLTTALNRDAARFVKTNKEKPFFLFVSYNAPHAPLQAPNEDIARYAHIKDQKRRIYAAMVDVMDRGIGEVVTALEENNLRENTLVFFLSDNGGPVSANGKSHGGNGSTNGPFRGGKTDYYDGGVHVPFIASWPARIKSGQTYDQPVISLDIGRTAVEIAGGDPVEGNAMEGVNLIPYLEGECPEAPHDALFWRVLGKCSILTSNGYKHIWNQKNSKPELFNLKDDIGEQNNIIEQHPELAQQMVAQWEQWDTKNVAMRNAIYSNYFRARDGFFIKTIPEEATKEGYRPKMEKMFSKE